MLWKQTWYFILGQTVVQSGLERSVMFNVKFDVSCGMKNVQKNL